MDIMNSGTRSWPFAWMRIVVMRGRSAMRSEFRPLATLSRISAIVGTLGRVLIGESPHFLGVAVYCISGLTHIFAGDTYFRTAASGVLPRTATRFGTRRLFTESNHPT